MLEYTIYAADNDPQGKYMWSLNCDTDHTRIRTVDAPEMIADVEPLGEDFVHAFTLLKKSNPEISEAKRKRDIVSVMGSDGNIDLLEGMLGYPVYDRRKFTESFVVLSTQSDERTVSPADRMEWAAIASRVTNFLNSHIGQFRIAPSDDKGFYWLGRVSASLKPDGYRAIVTIEADVEPYKLEKYHSCEPWLLADFSFIDGIERDYGNIEIAANSTETLEIPVRDMNMTPEFMVTEFEGGNTDNVQISTDGTTWYDAAFDGFTATELTIQGSPTPASRFLQIKNNTNTAKHIYVKVRGGSL